MVSALAVVHSMVGLLMPLTALDVGASPGVVGLLVASAYVLPVFLAMPVGTLADRVGSRKLLVVSAAAQVLGASLVVAWLSLPMLFVAQVCLGLAHLIYVISAQRYVSGLGVGSVGERNFGWFSTFQSGAQLLGAVVGGALLDGVGTRWSFAVAALLPLLAAFGLRYLPDISEARRTQARVAPFGDRGEMRGLLANPGVRLAIVVSCSVLVVTAVRQTFFPLYLEELSFSATAIGLLLSARGFAAMVVRPLIPGFVRLVRGRALALFATVVVLGLGIGMTTFVDDFALFLVASLLVGVSTGFSQPLTVVTVADHVPREKVGFALGFRLTGNRLAQALAPLVVGAAAEALGVRWSFLVAALAILATAPLVLAWRAPFEAAELRVRGEAEGTSVR